MELLDKIQPGLDVVRNILTKVAEFIANSFSLDVSNVSLILFLLISVWLSKKILEFFYTTLEGRKIYWGILTGIIFWVLKYLN